MVAVDFFCGAGGLTHGLCLAGINVLAGVDLDESCRRTYEANNVPSRFICEDITKINRDALVKEIPDLAAVESHDLLFAGCAPCQPFSSQKKAKKRGKGPDARLLAEFGRLVIEFMPGYVVVENVPGIALVKGNSTFKRFLALLKNAEYSVRWDKVDAKHYGVPQTRRRLVLVATRFGQASLPIRTHGPALQPYETVRAKIAHFPALEAGATDHITPNHQTAHITPVNIERIRNTPTNGGDRRAWPPELVLECHKGEYKGHTDVYGRMFWDRPAPTLTGKCNSISNGRYGHPEQNRAISLREAAALQTFPDNYVFYGKNGDVAQHIGNAVPVMLGHVIGNHILTLRREELNAN